MRGRSQGGRRRVPNQTKGRPGEPTVKGGHRARALGWRQDLGGGERQHRKSGTFKKRGKLIKERDRVGVVYRRKPGARVRRVKNGKDLLIERGTGSKRRKLKPRECLGRPWKTRVATRESQGKKKKRASGSTKRSVLGGKGVGRVGGKI